MSAARRVHRAIRVDALEFLDFLFVIGSARIPRLSTATILPAYRLGGGVK
jgi:hypothetical protein